MTDKTLESDGVITIYEIGSSKVVAQYEGLEVHNAMKELKQLRAQLDAAGRIFEFFGGLSNLSGWENAQGESAEYVVSGYAAFSKMETTAEETALRAAYEVAAEIFRKQAITLPRLRDAWRTAVQQVEGVGE